MKKGDYIPLQDFLKGMYSELIKAAMHANGLQAEYLARMASHETPLPVMQMMDRLSMVTFTITVHLKRTEITRSFWARIFPFLFRKTDQGIFFSVVTKNESEVSFEIKMARDATEPLIEPVLPKQTNYYVITKTR